MKAGARGARGARGKFVVTRGGVAYDARVTNSNHRAPDDSSQSKFMPDAEAGLLVMPTKTRNSAPFAGKSLVGILAALLAIAALGRAEAQPRKFEMGDVQKIVDVSSPAIGWHSLRKLAKKRKPPSKSLCCP